MSKNKDAKKFKEMLEGLNNDEYWIVFHFWLNHPGKSLDMVFADWKCEDCADFKFCEKGLSPPQCADIAAVLPRMKEI
jgi:hypothetical protein